jgi:EmrB/QacA subfamily drug resistance transporter
MAAEAGRPAPAVPSTPWAVFFVASIAVFLVSIDTTVLFAAFGALRAGFPDSTAADMSWVLNAYTVVYAALLVPAGKLADTHGRKRIFQLGLTLFLIASAACGAATSVGLLVEARVLQALGAALLVPSSLALVLGAFPAERRAVAVSLWGAVGGLAGALGPSVGAAVVDALNWRWAFFINLPLGLLAWWYGRSRLTEWRNADAKAPIDVPGIALLIAGVGAVAFGIVQSESNRWGSPAVAGWIAAGLGVLLVFVAWARRTPHPALDLSLFEDRTYRYVNTATLVFGIAFAMMFFGLFFFLMQVWHYPLPKAGLAVSPGPLLVVPVAIVAGRWAARIGHRPLLVGGALLYAAGGAVAVPAGRDRSRLPAYLAAGNGHDRHRGRHGAAFAKRCRGGASGARALRRGQRRQPGDPPDGRGARRRHDRGHRGARRSAAGGLPAPVRGAGRAGAADGANLPAGRYPTRCTALMRR